MVLVSIKNRTFKLFACLLVHFYSLHFWGFTDTYLFLDQAVESSSPFWQVQEALINSEMPVAWNNRKKIALFDSNPSKILQFALKEHLSGARSWQQWRLDERSSQDIPLRTASG